MKDSFHELCAKIGSPVVLDAANVGSYAHRLRNYWTNLVSSSALQCVLDSFERDPDLNLSDVLYTTNPQICTKTRSYPLCTANVPGKLLKVLPTLVARIDSYAFRSRPEGRDFLSLAAQPLAVRQGITMDVNSTSEEAA
ncbi:hypothetical protein CEUSTIGMA_g5813.t1 [Chlamydomonas eustigma]|uniref:Uncharacterized protein n=1 Tax=Chlamydomonas eustigma TaxID=1157962 RepID=A0A250X5L8_9CHLO|nr:hypothetical protein CEUSTIGMA_g5813.t1 [Chlamydomonas eustigma]|eukprot:GAX78371.1 hypothetical protein CEUSTIGMA_g5813.t1 [Chlamydomonas eustigma]